MRVNAKKNMSFCLRIFSIVMVTMCLYASCCGKEFAEELDDEEDASRPTINISVVIKDKEYSLPYFLTFLERLNYPKDRIGVCFYINHDLKSKVIIDIWAKKYQKLYKDITVFNMPLEVTESDADKDTPVQEAGGSDEQLIGIKVIPQYCNMGSYPEADSATRALASNYFCVPDSKWSTQRMKRIIYLKEKALNFARDSWADYVLMLDSDALLTNKDALNKLIKLNLPVVAPMLKADGEYANFWGKIESDYIYTRSGLYKRVYDEEKLKGFYQVPMVHTVVLINLRLPEAQKLTYIPSNEQSYYGPDDDIMMFATSANWNGIPMYICTEHEYGHMPIPHEHHLYDDTVDAKGTELEHFINVKVEAISDGHTLDVDPELEGYLTFPEPDRLDLGRIFVINLERRPERRDRMNRIFRELGLDVQFVTAVDGKTIRMDSLEQVSVRLLPAFEDPNSKRPMKAGEVGCFLSHYNIWKEIAKFHIPVSLVLEDDVRFQPFFRRRFNALMKELNTLDWDLVYIGRKPLDTSEEPVMSTLVKPSYSYWTIGYIITEAGARKLINAEPLTKMLPVDEFLPIMFDMHPNETWKKFYPQRDLKALAASPELVHPISYTGEVGYVSDTEDSPVLLNKDDSTSETPESYYNWDGIGASFNDETTTDEDWDEKDGDGIYAPANADERVFEEDNWDTDVEPRVNAAANAYDDDDWDESIEPTEASRDVSGATASCAAGAEHCAADERPTEGTS